MTRRDFVKLRIFLVTAMTAVAMGSCYQDGEDPYVLWDQLSHKLGNFSFYYMTPPFTWAEEFTDEHPVVIVEPYARPTEGHLESRIRVEAWSSSESLTDEMEARVRHWQNLGYSIGRNIRYVNYWGEDGVLLEVTFQDHWAKDIFYEFGSGCVAISAWTNEKGSIEDIEFLLASFRPGGSPE